MELGGSLIFELRTQHPIGNPEISTKTPVRKSQFTKNDFNVCLRHYIAPLSEKIQRTLKQGTTLCDEQEDGKTL